MRENYHIGKTCSPSHLLSYKEIPANEIHLSFGGGMGGGSQKLYATCVATHDDDFFMVTLVGGRKIKVGKRFIVADEPVTLVKVSSDITDWINHPNKEVKKHIKTVYYLIRKDESYERKTDVVQDSKKPQHVYIENEIEKL